LSGDAAPPIAESGTAAIITVYIKRAGNRVVWSRANRLTFNLPDSTAEAAVPLNFI